jgi:hypothetical protein
MNDPKPTPPTPEELKAALGPGYEIEDIGGLRITDGDHGDVACLDPETMEFENELICKFPGEPPADSPIKDDPATIIRALAAINEHLRPLWEDEGFTVSDTGRFSSYFYKNEPDKRLLSYTVRVSKRAYSLKDAANTIRAITGLESFTMAEP